MEQKDREAIALFKYGIIAPIISGTIQNQSIYFREICAKKHNVPYYGIKEYSPKTVEAWLRAYRRDGFDALKPKVRSDKNKPRFVTDDFKDSIINLRKEYIHLSVKLFHETIIASSDILPRDISYSSLYRLLKKENLLSPNTLSNQNRKRFAYEKVNTMWQSDLMHGPYLNINGKKEKSFLIAFIDDASRIITGAKFLRSEKFDDLKSVFEEALLRRGIPKIVYVDNGKIFRSDRLQFACASLGISLVNTKPYDPKSKGKIERFFRTVRLRFLPTLSDEDKSSFKILNAKFQGWLEIDYHRKTHSSLGATPLDIFVSQSAAIKMIDDPLSIKNIFLSRDKRKVTSAATISLKGNLYEAPASLISQSVEVRYDPNKLEKIFIYQDDILIASASKVNFEDNAKTKREIISFASLSGGENNV
ncbi:MAG: DDE-type integrase/transposase/recombinase [Marinisporobacter sp.]|jgi:transposase InsO family protein|nr:DDE-type integrase/transposase/recombinase [Marinisporobacter sp.]